MDKKVTRLRFSEDDLADKTVHKAADRAEKAADKAEQAIQKVSKPRKKLRTQAGASKGRNAKLHFENAGDGVVLAPPGRGTQLITRASSGAITSNAHRAMSEHEEDELDEINHNPYELASYLTVLFEDYTRDEVQRTLQRLFNLQYTLTLTEEVEIRTRTETQTETGTRLVWDDELGEYVEEEYEYEIEVEVEYEYYILNVKLTNHGLNYAIGNSGLTEDQMERYRLLLQTKGNRPDLFEGNIYATTGEYTDYDIPGEALTDVGNFLIMIQSYVMFISGMIPRFF